ncbi:MAG: hypothetical protein AAGC83_09105 [Pseudomonadota bacterium]
MIAPRFVAFIAAGLLALTPIFGAHAQDSPSAMDRISLDLSAEDWVSTDEPKVTVGVEAAFQGADAASVRAEILATLDSLSEDAEWRFVRFNRSVGPAGLEQFSAAAEARLADIALDGLVEKIDEAERPGLELDLLSVAFTPTLAERQAVASDLRARIYEMAAEELDQVNGAYPDRDFRVASIEFYQGAVPVYAEQRGRILETVQAAADAFTGQGVSVSQQMILTARLVLEAPIPE